MGPRLAERLEGIVAALACTARIGKWRILGEIHAAQLLGACLLIYKAGFRAAEFASCVGPQQMPVATHPAGLSAGHALDQGVVGHILCHHGASGDEAVSPEGDAADDGGVGPNGSAAADNSLLVETVPVDLGTRVGDVCQHAGGTKEDVVLDGGAGVDRHVVLNLDVVARNDAVRYEGVLAENALFSDAGAGADVGEVPDFRSGANHRAEINDGCGVDEIGGGAHSASMA